MDFIKGLWRDLRARPVDTLVRWQEQRFLWLLMAIAMGGLIILAHSFFQIYLYMAPCEQCVYIRYAAFYGSIMGIKFSIKLNGIHHAVHNADPDSLFGVQGCSTDPTFPFNLPLAEWAPEWFKPTGDCGYDAPIVPDGVTLSSVQQWFVDLYQQSEGWYLLPPWHFMNMAQACMLAFGLCLILLLVMSGAWALKLARGK
ncbi:protein-disulfide oxidoreductase DsbI [Salmonella enterica subsp. enterica serovar Javiana]|nr:protein-disulfide oxidoreductase DsbI [Salmonella enterica]EDR1535359.1 protein-disulfide oxidoreductase DsbI [Salmonella enterica subsp. enterica serovar Javiana]EIV1870719.1 protein-disulfide oxidoreductase DsbI [Salmonella enterica]EKB2992322.1 protein-disulfide oxidoreductase DsbI [Salmonella enterica]